MIVFDVKCAKEHVFTEWFDNGADYDAKAANHEIACPECGDREISKALMAPSVSTGAKAPAPACGAPECANMGCPMARP